MFDQLTTFNWILMAVASFIIGFSKTGLPGIGTLAVLLAAVAVGGKSPGLVLPMLIFGDIFAIIMYRQHIHWKWFLLLLPWAVVGVVIGFVINLKLLDTETSINRFIGFAALGLLAMNVIRTEFPALDRRIPRNWAFAAVFGLMAGIVTMIANAAGPIMTVYLLAMNFDKEKFIGTGAAYYAFVNVFKVPFQQSLGGITADSLLLDAACLPAVFAGAMAGIWAFKRIRQEVFLGAAEALMVLAAAKLAIWKMTGLSDINEALVAWAVIIPIIVAVAVYRKYAHKIKNPDNAISIAK
jgi:uncharacterized protein